MKGKALGAFKSKLLRPCKKLLLFFRLKPKKPVFIRALKFRAHKSTFPKAFPTKPTMSSLLQSVFRSPKKSKHTDMLQGLRSPSNVHETPLFPSPLTPACVKACGAEKGEEASRQEVGDACRSFENYLVEMIVEEGKTRDLMDVEELLYCWKSLKCPVFIDLVSRFYGELCKDLFSPDSEEGDCSM
ncbi:Transcription repressor OFP17 [Spatholobus suberectus]|nr:Transcription repressor OFP17 [Spatholobus suberectus]